MGKSPQDGSLGAPAERLSLKLHAEEVKSSQQTEDAIEKGARALVMLKMTVAIIVLLAAIIVSSLTYILIRQQEEAEFESRFVQDSRAIIQQFLDQTQVRFWSSYELSVEYTIEFEQTPQAWPMVTLPRFQVQTFGSTSVSRSNVIAFSPIVSEKDRQEWEQYVVDNQNLLFENERRPQRLYENKRELQSLQHSQIYRLSSAGNSTEVDPGPGPYLPIYQVSPLHHNEATIMYNQRSFPTRNQTLDIMLSTRRPQVSAILYPESTTPSSVLYFPVGTDFSNSADIVGTTSIEFNWEDTLRQGLPLDNAGIVVVLENSYGQEYTFMVQGQQVIFMGAGDLHDAQFDDMEAPATFADFLAHTAVNASQTANIFQDTRRQVQQQDGCLYSIRVYPTHEFHIEYVTNRPILCSVGAAMVFVFCTAIFFLYEWLAGRQYGVVMETLARSSAIVHSLFPETVRDRMLLDAERNLNRPTRRRASGTDGLIRHRFSYVHGDTPRKKLLSFLKGSTYSKMDDPELQTSSTSEPIADFFPNTTVMFADIAGFTAWSSDREPSEVFHLLETVWAAFDAIARRLGVFKIETVGDCYVCVTGLPDPNDDHALIMTRFAYECLHKMKELTQNLEVTLGPGTTDLEMRFGLHSGPVTAGVLRGEKARFQLFGDTMNTAARMESTGERNRVQISESTAALLREAGKEHWFYPRENLVTAKGKGQLQTYWVKQGRMTRSGGKSSGSQCKTEDTIDEEKEYMPSKLGLQMEYDAQKPGGGLENSGQWFGNSMMTLETTLDGPLIPAGDKTARLVDWNVDILLGLLSKVVKKRERSMPIYTGGCVVEETSRQDMPGGIGKSFRLRIDNKVKQELHDFVAQIASRYRDVAFHNFEHASHVAMTANNLMKRITERDKDEPRTSTFGIRSDPLSHFAVVFSALVHDVNPTGSTNGQATSERKDSQRAVISNAPSSMELTWELLMQPRYKHLRSCIYADAFERDRFRQFLVNCVKATDITDMELRAIRKKRWNAAFNASMTSTSLTPQEVNSRKATIVIELIMQTASAAHYSQHWEMYCKWNESLFTEMYQAYREGTSDRDPSVNWFENEIIFFDNHVIPLAKMIKVCGVFAGCNEENLTYALQNKKEWEMKGKELCKEMLAKIEKDGTMV
jgi:class 3 adenylate cyclase